MDDERQNAYRYLLYQATLDIRMVSWQGFRWWNPFGLFRSLRAARFAGRLADAMHNLAKYSSIGFDKFDEGLFWGRMECLCSEFPDFGSLVGRYRHRFEMALFESEFGQEPDRQKALEQIAGSKADRIEFHSEATPSIVSEIELGVLFVMAFWSGAAIFAYRDLLDVVASHDPEKRLQIVVVDADGAAEFQQVEPFNGRLHGRGETFWIRDGQIVADSAAGLNLQCVEPNTIALLAGE